MKEEKTFDEICYNFQKKIVDIFNNEEQIPFILKYYLMKDIWTNIEQLKMKDDMSIRSKQQPQIETITLGNYNNENQQQQQLKSIKLNNKQKEDD